MLPRELFMFHTHTHTHTVFSHLQQELNYRFLQEQNGGHSATGGVGGVILAPQHHHMPQVVHPQPTTINAQVCHLVM